jgi:hypothetical protein
MQILTPNLFSILGELKNLPAQLTGETDVERHERTAAVYRKLYLRVGEEAEKT